MSRRTLAFAVLALATLASSAHAQNGRREIGTYSMGGATLRVSAAAPRVELLVVHSPTTMMVYLEGRSVLAWADSADALLGLSREDLARDSAELSTTVLQHPDPSYASGVKLTRVFTRKRTKCFLYVWVGRHNYTAIPLSDRDARSVVSALKRAAAELRDSAR